MPSVDVITTAKSSAPVRQGTNTVHGPGIAGLSDFIVTSGDFNAVPRPIAEVETQLTTRLDDPTYYGN